VRFGREVALLFIQCLTQVFRYHSADLLDPALAGHAECKSGRKQRLSLSLCGCEPSEVRLAQAQDCLALSAVCRHTEGAVLEYYIQRWSQNRRRKGETFLHPELFFSLSLSLSLDAKTWAKWFSRNLSDCDVSISHLPLVEHRLKKYTYCEEGQNTFFGLSRYFQISI